MFHYRVGVTYLGTFPHLFAVDPDHIMVIEVLQWCEDQFGRAGAGCRHTFTSRAVYIRDKNDAFAFRMRWC